MWSWGAQPLPAEDVPELCTRMNLIGAVPALQAGAAHHDDDRERAVSEFAAVRLGRPADSLYPLASGRATLVVCRSGHDRRADRADADLAV
jgi:TetR/AcrR family transcriptional regulator, regulator of mycofactocin system